MDILDATTWQRPQTTSAQTIDQRTSAILAEIQADGDPAIERFSQRFDGFAPSFIPLEPWDCYPLETREKQAIAHAAERIEAFAKLQKSMYRDMHLQDDCGTFSHRIIPLESMAAYIPGGRFPLISTALMTLIPARIAGVQQRTALSPSNHPALLAAASLAGATQFLRIGGAQAIATAALGYDSLRPADMVVGPGNAYVNAAKSQLQSRIKIDTLAGPSELLILADDAADAQWIYLDMLAQAEHDPQALSVLASTSRPLLEEVRLLLLEAEGRPDVQEIGAVSLVYAADNQALIEFSERMAPEHLHLNTRPEALDPEHLTQYGSLFIGNLSAVAFGDYCSGPNHTLPTSGYARMKGGLQTGDFLKVQTVQQLTQAGVNTLATTGEILADLEGLRWHAKSMSVRKKTDAAL